MNEKEMLLNSELSKRVREEVEATLEDLRVLENFPAAVDKAFTAATAQMDALSTTLCEEADRRYREITAKRTMLSNAISSLSSECVRLPYCLKDVLGIAEQCSRFTDAQWARVIELAKALSLPKEDPQP